MSKISNMSVICNQDNRATTQDNQDMQVICRLTVEFHILWAICPSKAKRRDGWTSFPLCWVDDCLLFLFVIFELLSSCSSSWDSCSLLLSCSSSSLVSFSTSLLFSSKSPLLSSSPLPSSSLLYVTNWDFWLRKSTQNYHVDYSDIGNTWSLIERS